MPKPDDLKIYETLSQPDPKYLKAITGGRLRGKTDINPQWRYRVMTEQFGLCGIGWKYSIEKLWTEPGADGEIMCFANVFVYIKQTDGWSDPIPGTGGNMLVTKESKGLYNSDEGYKMAVTDALSNALKMLGVGAAIYEGSWDGSKYRDAPETSDLEEWEFALTSASTLDELRKIFERAYEKYKSDVQALTHLTQIKDTRKRELSQ